MNPDEHFIRRAVQEVRVFGDWAYSWVHGHDRRHVVNSVIIRSAYR